MDATLKGTCENNRNAANRDLYKAIIKEVYGVEDVIVGHHIVFVTVETRKDSATGIDFDYQCVQELASADTLIFDHEVAERLWGVGFLQTLARLAAEPVPQRDVLLGELYYGRSNK